MSTHDVPGIKDKKTGKKINNDALAMGCWAEADDPDDDSMIFVLTTEGGRVIYDVFDFERQVSYRDAMAQGAFEREFSWTGSKKKKGKDDRWVWHDKTPFDWDKVIQAGFMDGYRDLSAEHTLNQAQRVAESRKLKGKRIDSRDYDHLAERAGPRTRGLIARIGSAIKELRA